MKRSLSVIALFATAHPLWAQTSIDPAHKFAWQENAGWTNWADGASPARVHATFLSGSIWSENCGWITLGDGTPGGAGAYTNASGSDHGVNIALDGRLSGFAWGENIGWITFDTAAALGASGSARLDRAAGRFRGWAWAENLGWLNLDDATAYIALSGGGCYANCDGSTVAPNLNVNDFLCFQNRFAAGDPFANCDASTTPPILNINDFLCFSNRFAVGCP